MNVKNYIQSVVIALLLAATVFGGGVTAEHFIRVQDGEFVNGCEKFFPSGWNQWEVCEAAAGAPELLGACIPPWKTGPEMVRNMLYMGKRHGFNVMRTWASPTGANYAMQTSPGVYNEGVFRGLDYALEAARVHGIRVILAFIDNWHVVGGVGDFLRWSPTATDHNDFFTDHNAKEMYKDHVRAIVNRTNTVNGRVYKDDPTIMAWNLINEPRCYGCPEALQAWIDEMAPFVKTLDSNHLLTVGEEGFYSTSDKIASNPRGGWPRYEGQDSLNNHRSPSIDYVSFHSWVDNWDHATEEFQRSWIRAHADDGKRLGKPVLLQEFGKALPPGNSSTSERDLFFRAVYDEVREELRNGYIKGALFWNWYDEGQVAFESEHEAGKYGIYSSDPTFQIIKDFSWRLSKWEANVTSCRYPGRSIELPANCHHTTMNGIAGTGYEGPNCDVDINECVRGTVKCPPNSGCINTDGGARCSCHYGYIHDGSGNCTPAFVLGLIEVDFYTYGAGQLACIQGEDIQYPAGAPGFVYDPAGSFEKSEITRGQMGSRTAATLLDCKIACYMSGDECDSFGYNPQTMHCFLQKCPSGRTCYNPVMFRESEKTGKNVSIGQWQTYFSRTRSCGWAGGIDMPVETDFSPDTEEELLGLWLAG